MQISRSIIVKGKVQGVFFRQSTAEKATTLGITGEVKNETDGSVHIIATGTEEQLNELIAWCRQGPPKAKVISVESSTIPLHTFTRFNIIRH